MGDAWDDTATDTPAAAAADATTGEPYVWPTVSPETLARRIEGVELRYVLTDLIHGPERAEWTVAQLVDELDRSGFTLYGRASKAVSDALRWEVGRGRVVRVGRSRYRPGTIPGTTRRRIRSRARARRVGAERARWAQLAAQGGDGDGLTA